MSRRLGTVRLAVVGAGKIGAHRARLAAEHAGVRELGVVDVETQRAEHLAETVGADWWETDVEAAISTYSPDAVIVSTPEGAHHGPVMAALNSGAAVLVEKPLALDLTEAEEMSRAEGDLWVGYSMRYAQRFAVAKQQIEEGKEGYSAILDSAVSRMRPVMLAAATTILGLIPLLSDVFFVNMSITMMAGLGFATLLTLFIIPVLYSLFFRVPYRDDA